MDWTVPVDQDTTYSPLYLQKDAYCVACGVYVQMHMHMYSPTFFLQKQQKVVYLLMTRDKNSSG